MKYQITFEHCDITDDVYYTASSQEAAIAEFREDFPFSSVSISQIKELV